MKIEGKEMQLVARSKAEAAEEGAEIKEVDVATRDLMSRHQEQRVRTARG